MTGKHLLFVGLALACVTTTALAEPETDMARLTCSHLAAMSPESAAYVVVWSDGYNAGATQRPKFSNDRIKRLSDKVNETCKRDPGQPVLQIVSGDE